MKMRWICCVPYVTVEHAVIVGDALDIELEEERSLSMVCARDLSGTAMMYQSTARDPQEKPMQER